MSNRQHRNRPNHFPPTRAVVGPVLRGRPITDYADHYGIRLRYGRPVGRRSDRYNGG